MNDYDYYDDDDEIYFLDLCLYLFGKIKQILLFTLCITALTTCVFFVKNNIDLKNEKKLAQIERVQARIDYLEKYKDESIYLNLNPTNIYSSTSIIEVYGIDSNFYLNSISDKNSVNDEINEILNKYISIYNAADLNNLVDGLEDKYIRELIEITSSNSFLIINARYKDKDTAGILSSKVADVITSKYDQVNEISNHKIRNSSTASTSIVMDANIEKAYKDLNSELKEAKTELSKLKNGNLLLFDLIGFAGGLFIICAYYVLIYLVKGFFTISETLENSADIKCFGTLHTINNKTVGERVYKDRQTALSYIKNMYDLEFNDNEKVLLTSSLSINENEVEDIIKTLGDKVLFASDYLHNPEVIGRLKDIKNVVLLERAGASSISKIKKIKAQLSDLNIRLAGFIELN